MPSSSSSPSPPSSSSSTYDRGASAWNGIEPDIDALYTIVQSVFPRQQVEQPVMIAPGQGSYARIYSFALSSGADVIARLIAPVKPLFKTEGEVAAMDYARRHTSLPVPAVYMYCSEADNPVGAEWVLMERMPGVELETAWPDLGSAQRRRTAVGLVDIALQTSRLKASACGGIYHTTRPIDDSSLIARSTQAPYSSAHSRRWRPLSADSLRKLREHCRQPLDDLYDIGPMQEVPLLDYENVVPGPHQTMPVTTSSDYVRMLAWRGVPTTRSALSRPCFDQTLLLFKAIQACYPTSRIFGQKADGPSSFRFFHGDLHPGNLLVDQETGAITGILDWEAAGFRPLWADTPASGWFEEDHERFITGSDDPGEFINDTTRDDISLRAYFRTQLYHAHPDLFACFLGGVEYRALLGAASDAPAPDGETDIWLSRYHKFACWSTQRRGLFPWDMDAWANERYDNAMLEEASRENDESVDS